MLAFGGAIKDMSTDSLLHQVHSRQVDRNHTVDKTGEEIARGLVNYHSDEVIKLKGKASSQIGEILGYVDEPELINRDNMVVQVG